MQMEREPVERWPLVMVPYVAAVTVIVLGVTRGIEDNDLGARSSPALEVGVALATYFYVAAVALAVINSVVATRRALSGESDLRTTVHYSLSWLSLIVSFFFVLPMLGP